MTRILKAIWHEMTRPMTEEELKNYNEALRNGHGPWGY